MVELVATSPCAGVLPKQVGAITLAEADLGVMTTIAPFAGQEAAVSQALKEAHGVGFPPLDATIQKDGTRVLWFGRDMALLTGQLPDAGLAKFAALTDQSDGWAAIKISGSGVEDVLARLVPVDLRPSAFAEGQTCRTLVGHMAASITRTGKDALLILVFRSMATTLVDELHEAMEAVAARG
ncbi:MAG: sarcosine oxidase subunit gamma family protein [Pseudomonadota bacterium]